MAMTTPPPIPRLPADYNEAELQGALTEAGCCVIEGAVSGDVMDAVAADMAPHLEATPRGDTDFAGVGTRRTGLAVSHSATYRDHLARHRAVLAAGEHLLGHAHAWNLSFAHYFELFPGEPQQYLHRDVWKYGAPPFGVEVDVNVLWAVTDFTEDNGATRLIPGSHLWPDDRRAEPGEDVPAIAPKGSMVLYTGNVFHGGGANVGETVRLALNAQHSVGWLSQTELLLLEYPPAIAAAWDDDLIRFIGYQRSGPALGHWRTTEDPFVSIEEYRAANPLNSESHNV